MAPLVLEDLARRAIDGDRDALDGLIRGLQADVYALAIRMLWNREDAEDATQEILVRVITRLSQFDFRSRIKTWTYRVAVNYILDVKKSAVEQMRLTFEQFADDLADGLSPEPSAEDTLLVEEVKIGCTLGMLQCLDRPHRLAYVLGEIFEMTGPEAADVLGVTPDLFRKRLQHAREGIESFTRSHCGLVSDTAACSCDRRVPAAMQVGRARADALAFAQTPTSFERARRVIRQVESARQALEVHRRAAPRGSATDFAPLVLRAIDRAWTADGGT
ncbi:MAG: RNA polymerase sigma factor [Vicinamibacterales bacterium]